MFFVKLSDGRAHFVFNFTISVLLNSGPKNKMVQKCSYLGYISILQKSTSTVSSEEASTKPPCNIGGSPPFSRRRGAARHRPSSVRPSSARRLLSSFCCPHPLSLSVRSFVSWRGSVAHSPPSLSLSPLVRSLVRPLSPIIVARSFARSLASIVPLSPLYLAPFVRSF